MRSFGRSIFLTVVIFAIVGLVFANFHSVEALQWPKKTDGIAIQNIAAHNVDNIAIMNCDEHSVPYQFTHIAEGYQTSVIAESAESGVRCSNPHDVVSQTSEDGTVYTKYTATVNGQSEDRMAAIKNGRVKWSTSIMSDPQCSAAGGQQYASPYSTSIGPDGNVYTIIQSLYGNCAKYIAGYNAATGDQLFKHYLGTAGPNRLWTFDDKMVVVDGNGLLREYGYDGVENVSKRYQFPTVANTLVRNMFANEDGRVFLVYDTPWDCKSNVNGTYIRYHDNDGSTGMSTLNLGCNVNYSYKPVKDGNVAVYGYSNRVFVAHMEDNNHSVNFVVPGSGYNQSTILNYWEDENAIGVLVRELRNSSNQKIISIDEFNASTGAINNITQLQQSSSGNDPSIVGSVSVGIGDIADDFLYIPVCYSECNSFAESADDTWIHRVNLPGSFGTAYKNVSSIAERPSVEATEYIAMGDSYSSGEGVEPFVYGTAWPGVNECHRSAEAYSMLLEEDASLNLDMTSFVACSGAETQHIINSGNVPNGELPQAIRITQDTDLVTLSIGGNDAGFGEVLKTCVLKDPADETDQESEQRCLNAIAGAGSIIDGVDLHQKLQDVYEGIVSLGSPSMQLVVTGYPQLFPEFGNITSSCTWGTNIPSFFGMTSGRSVSGAEVTAMRLVTNKMNALISDVIHQDVNDPRVHFINPTNTFAGHELCTAEPWFNNVVESLNPSNQPYSYHPNLAGQQAYYTDLKPMIAQLIGSI